MTSQKHTKHWPPPPRSARLGPQLHSYKNAKNHVWRCSNTEAGNGHSSRTLCWILYKHEEPVCKLPRELNLNNTLLFGFFGLTLDLPLSVACASGGTFAIPTDSQHKVHLGAKLTNISSSWILTPNSNPSPSSASEQGPNVPGSTVLRPLLHPHGKAQD